jgi:hypothetical protein
MAAGVLNIYVEQGATWQRQVAWTQENGDPINIVGYSARMMIRERYRSDEPIVSLDSDPGGGIVITAPNLLDITMTAAQTALIDFGAGVYDLELVAPDGRVIRLLQGTAEIGPEATK